MKKARGRARILLVDDERVVRDAIKMLLEIDNREVVEAADGERALALLEEQEFDMVLTDFRMGLDKMTGGDLAVAVKQRSPSLPIVLVTGFHDEVPPGVIDAVLFKPFSLEQLREVIRKFLGPRESR